MSTRFPIRFDWKDLELILALAETGSIAAAAQRNHLVASAVSKRLSDLEQQFGAALVERHARGVRLTPAGEALRARAVHLLDEAHRLQGELQDYASGVTGHVRLFANISAIVEFLPRALAAFRDTYPGIRVELQEQVSADVAQAVRAGVADLGIVSELPHMPDLTFTPFRQDELQLVVPAGHPLAAREQLPFTAALDYPLVGLHANSTLHVRLTREAAQAGRELRPLVQVTSFDAVCAMVAAGLGVGVVPRAATTPYVQSLGLTGLTLSDDWAHRQLCLCTRADTVLSPATHQLFTHLQQTSETATG
ncbi:LysR family transcriptional regulator [Silvimonas iriomotensis]|uniref:LysR family transcriptional regulator n=1 Tax=Silvimonas iriomotensis TaxID=449662 RepID=A0ABQ2P4V2_9NEIS|nr:LysR family transcriptional regulator [Silvimonas iriomotensis]GGP18421.1 LysR family transcriptional regulator [Silvimonas iriomotensis]